MRRMALATSIGVVGLLLACGQAGAMVADVPMPVIVQQCDLIVQASAVKAGEPGRKELRIPELNYSGARALAAKQAKLVTAHFRTYTLKVEKIHRDVSGQVKVGARIEAVTRARPPRPAGGPLIHVADGPMYINLRVGQSYLVVLRSMGRAKGYYLPNYFKCFSPPAGAAKRLGLQSLSQLNVQKWGWGKADPAGLEMAVFVKRPVYAFTGMNRQRQRVTSLSVMMAVRNASDKPVTLTADAALRPLGLKLTTADGKPVAGQPDLYRFVKQPDPRSKPPIQLNPGEVVFLCEVGPSAWYNYVQTMLGAGKYKAVATYSVSKEKLPKPDGDKKDAPAVWSGTIESAPAEFEVMRNPSRRPRPQGPT